MMARFSNPFAHWNWGWNHGDPYMRGWGIVLWLTLLVVFLVICYLTYRKERRSGHA